MKCDSPSRQQTTHECSEPTRTDRIVGAVAVIDRAQAGSTEEDIRSGMARGEFFLEFQPQFAISGADCSLAGVEALVRWHHPTVGLLLPGEFLPEVEAFGLHCELGVYVFQRAVNQIRDWLDTQGWSPRVAINMAAQQLDSQNLCRNVLETLEASGVSTGYIELELVESEVIRNSAHVSNELRALSAAGVTIAVDDFGTGFASLHYLLQFPLDSLKICSSFIQGIGRGTGADEICEAIIQLGRALEKRVVAEGVETPEQLAFLRAHHCSEAQGFLLARPLSGAAIASSYMRATVP